MQLRSGPQFAWWNLSRAQKAELQEGRLRGRFGGLRAAFAGRAPYFWAQEYGNAAAAITGQHFAERSWKAYKTKEKEILFETVRDILSG